MNDLLVLGVALVIILAVTWAEDFTARRRK